MATTNGEYDNPGHSDPLKISSDTRQIRVTARVVPNRLAKVQVVEILPGNQHSVIAEIYGDENSVMSVVIDSPPDRLFIQTPDGGGTTYWSVTKH